MASNKPLIINVDTEWNPAKLTWETEWLETKKSRILRPIYDGHSGAETTILLHSDRAFKAPFGLTYKEKFQNAGEERTSICLSAENHNWLKMVYDIQNQSIAHLVKHAATLMPWMSRGVTEASIRDLLWNFGLEDDEFRAKKEQKSTNPNKKKTEMGKFAPIHRVKVATEGFQITRVFTESGQEMEIKDLPHKSFGSQEKVGFSVKVFVRLPHIYLISNKFGNSWAMYQMQYLPYNAFANSGCLFGTSAAASVEPEEPVEYFSVNDAAPQEEQEAIVDKDRMMAMAMAAQAGGDQEDILFSTPPQPQSPPTLHQPELTDEKIEEMRQEEENRAKEVKRKFATSGAKSVVKEPTKKSRSAKAT